MFKTITAAAVSGALALPAQAGGLGKPILEPEIIIEAVEETSSSAGGSLPIIIFALLVTLASS